MTMVALNMMLTRHISEGFASDFEYLLTGELTAIKKSVEIKSSSIWKYSDDDLEAPADLSCPLEICRRAIRC